MVLILASVYALLRILVLGFMGNTPMNTKHYIFNRTVTSLTLRLSMSAPLPSDPRISY